MKSTFELGFGVTEREITVDRLPVQGELPAWLSGTLLRNGPGAFRVGQEQYRHWFDGLAMLHKFSFANGCVAYANKFLETNSYRSAMERGRITYSEFATDPCRSLFGRAMSVFSPQVTDSAKVSIAKIAGRFMALAETPIQVEFDPETLKTVGVFNWEEGLFGQMTTVHPQFDSERQEVYNLVTRYHRVSHYNIYKLDDRGAKERVVSLPVNEPGYMHSFGMSPNYFILTEFPLLVHPLKLLLWLKPYIENFQWKPQRGTRFLVIDRRSGQIMGRYTTPAFFAFHHVNAFEEGDDLVVDLVAYPDAGILDAFYLERLKDESLELPFGRLERYRLSLKGKTITRQVLSEECMELPRFDWERYNMRGDYRYVYAASLRSDQRRGFYNQIVKADIHSGEARTWFAPDCYPGEPVFVRCPEGDSEDDGVLLSVVLDSARGNSFLLVLDARDLREVARAEIPHPILFGYHGEHYGQ